MIRTVKTCDRCGDPIDHYSTMVPIGVVENPPAVTGLYFAYRHTDPKPLETFRMDLCDECLESFDNWFGKYNKTLLFDDFEESDNTDE